MSDKERKTFSLQKQNAELCDELDNASAVVDDLLTQYRKGSDKDTVAIDLLIEQKERALRGARKDTERLEGDLEELKQLKAGMKQQDSAELQEARQQLEDVPKEPTNPAVENWADKLGMTPSELLEVL